MFHRVYPTSWLFGNYSGQQKSPVFMTYNDVPVITLDPVTTFIAYGQLQSVYSSQVLLDPSMKRIPVNMLMRGTDSLNCYVPMLQWKDFGAGSVSQRRFSKESLLDSSICSDSGTASSRSSTPSSVGPVLNAGLQNLSPHEKGPSPPVKRQRKLSDPFNNPYVHSFKQKHSPLHQRFSSTVVKQDLQFALPGDPWDKVSQEIWRHYIKNRQPEEMFRKKMRLHSTVLGVLNQIFPNCGLCVVGSSVNGLGANTSDMDMCLILASTEIDQQNEAMMLLTYVQDLLKQKSFIKSTDLITAKVPILKFTDKCDIQVDLNINNTVGIANTYLIRNYCCLDWRVQPLVLVIKKWAQDYDINNAKNMTLSSYSLTLMVLHYLQCGCYPCVLPCLQKMRPKRYSPENCITWQDSLNDLPNFKSRNTESLGELLFGFFDYFSNKFDFDRDVMSVRLGYKLPKHVAMNYRSAKNKRGHWRYICIEEPFNRTNTACAVYDKDSFTRIFIAFRTTWLNLKKNRDFNAVLKL